MRVLLRLLTILILSLSIARPGLAYVFKLDNLAIEENGSLFFEDRFEDGIPPPSSPSGPNTYRVKGAVGPEEFGKLTLDQKDAVVSTTSTGRGELVQAIRGNTGIFGNQPGFYKGDSVSVTAIFDLIQPDARLQGYGVRFTDSASGIGIPGKDLPQARVRRTSLDTLQVQFVNASFLDNTFEIISRAILNTTHEQIALMLDLDMMGLVTASYAYLDGGVAGSTMTLPGSSQIFEVEDWTRVEVIAQQTLVPEPATLALMGLGLAGLHYRRRSAEPRSVFREPF